MPTPFRDETEARARIESLERALDEKQQALDAARAELGVERGSPALVPPDLAWHRAEVERLRGRLTSASAERERLSRDLMRWRSRAAVALVLLVVLVFGVVLVAYGLYRMGHELILAVCRDELGRTCE